MGILIRYFDIAPDALESFVATSSDKQSFVDVATLSQRGQYVNYMTVGELNQTILDKTQQIIPDTPVPATFGWWSKSMSLADKSFAAPLVLTLISDDLFTSQGIELTFDAFNNVYATSLSITWYANNELLSAKTFAPDKAVFFCDNRVEAYNKLIIEIYTLNVPFSYLKLQSIEYGTIRHFDGTEIKKAAITKSLNPISSEINISTLDFELVSDKSTEYIFQRKQALEVYRADDLDGIYFVEAPKQLTHNVYSIQAVDYIGLMDKTPFNGGMYYKERASTLLNAIFTAANVPYEILGDIGLAEISGHIPICTCREAAMYIAFAIGAAISTSRSAAVKVFALSDIIQHEYTESEIGINPSVDETDRITALLLSEHTYTLTTTAKELYKATADEAGTRIRLEFNEPYGSLSIVNGTLIESSANHAIIDVFAGCVLSGRPYTHTVKVLQRNNTVANARNAQNVVRIQDATLVSADNSHIVLDRCFNYLAKNKIVNVKLITQDTGVGDTVTLPIPYVGVVTGIVESMRYSLRGDLIVADAEVRV